MKPWRHLHPNEALALNGMDPTLGFGTDVKLSLAACGQLASPIQVVWVLGSVASKLRLLKPGSFDFDSTAQLLTFRSWIFAKCQLVWPREVSSVPDANFLALVECWHPVIHLSLRELLVPSRWQSSLNELDVSLASVLDVLIKTASAAGRPRTMGFEHMEIDSDEPAPWYDCPTPDLTASESGVSMSCCQVVLPYGCFLPSEPRMFPS